MMNEKNNILRRFLFISLIFLLVLAINSFDQSMLSAIEDTISPGSLPPDEFQGTILNSTWKTQDDTATGPILIDILLTSENPTATITQKNANFISLHFAEFNLLDGDYVSLADKNGNIYYSYPDAETLHPGEGAGWASLVFGDTIQLELHSAGDSQSMVRVDYYFYAPSTSSDLYESGGSIVNIDDKEDIACYTGAIWADIVETTEPVALLYNANTTKYCTAFMVGPDGYVLTNEHCVTNATELASTDLYFNYQYTTCGGATLDSFTYILPGNMTFIKDSPESTGYDYALLHVTDTSSIDSFGNLWLDISTPEDEERLYIPQHPGGGAKELAYYDTEQPGGNCNVESGVANPKESMYTCDTEDSSSGSPVVSFETGEVFILHHASNDLAYPFTANFGIRVEEFWSEIDEYIRPRTVRRLDSPNDDLPNYDTTPTYTITDPTMAEDIRFWISHNTEGVIYNEWVARSGICPGDGYCSYTPPVEHPYGIYSVMFQTRNTAGTSEWSEEFTWTLGETPDAPTISTPTGNTPLIRPTYTWGAVDYAEEYRVFISHASVGTMINEWVDQDGICNAVTCDWISDIHLRTGNHSWWVMARNGIGASAWSSPVVFKIWNTSPPTGSVTKDYPYDGRIFDYSEIQMIWYENINASWYKVYMTDAIGKLYNQYHRAAEICAGQYCFLDYTTFEPLLHAPRGLSELPEETWIHWNVMPVNVAGNGDWTGYTKFWISLP